jgi:hypothetical protein
MSAVAMAAGGALMFVGPDGHQSLGFYSGLLGIYLGVLSLRE